MIRAKIKIGTGAGDPVYTDTTYGLVYLDSDKVVSAPVKGYETTTYPEEEGEHILPKTVDDAFDYKVKFFIQATSLESANAKIVAFNNALLPLSSGQRTANVVEFYNYCKRHKIVGYPQPVNTATEFWRDSEDQTHDVVVVEWTIRVTKPSLCDFNLTA